MLTMCEGGVIWERNDDFLGQEMLMSWAKEWQWEVNAQKRTYLRDTEKVEWTGLGRCPDVSSRVE